MFNSRYFHKEWLSDWLNDGTMTKGFVEQPDYTGSVKNSKHYVRFFEKYVCMVNYFMCLVFIFLLLLEITLRLEIELDAGLIVFLQSLSNWIFFDNDKRYAWEVDTILFFSYNLKGKGIRKLCISMNQIIIRKQ